MDAQIAEWQSRAEALKPLNLKQIEGPLGELSDHLTMRSFVVGYEYTAADETLYQTIRGNRVAHAYVKQGLMPNLCRWFRFVEVFAPKVVVVQGQGKAKVGGDGANYDIG